MTQQNSHQDHVGSSKGTPESLSEVAHGTDPTLQQRYVVEWGAISLPLGHPSRATIMVVYDTFAEASAAAEACEFDSRVFAIHIPDPARAQVAPEFQAVVDAESAEAERRYRADWLDAARYRFLRNSAVFFTPLESGPSPWAVFGIGHDDATPCQLEALDEAVDVAIAALKDSMKADAK